jgi:hypothetical protein
LALVLPSDVVTAGLSTHEMFVFAADQQIYIWDIKFARRFKRTHEDYRALHNVRQIALGRSMHLFVEGVLIPQMTQVVACPKTSRSGEPFSVQLQLFDQFGPVEYKAPPISILFSKDEQKPSNSSISYQLSVSDTPTTLQIVPLGFGSFYLHILINSSPIPSPPQIQVLASEDELESARQVESLRQQEAQKEKERQEKQAKLESEKKKSQQALEEQNKKKKEETDKRAAETLKSHRLKQEKEKEEKERERKQKLEMKTGGGYDLNKRKK